LPETDRRTVIADAALRLIGERGARGLTHRGVDAEAGLPQGSTSYYCRRRIDLLGLVIRRHAELDLRALAPLATLVRAGAAGEQGQSARLAAGLARFVRGQTRAQLTARFELFLAASREPALCAIVDAQRDRFVSGLADGLKSQGIPRPRSVAAALIALTEGLLLERVRVDREAQRPAELRAMFTWVLEGART